MPEIKLKLKEKRKKEELLKGSKNKLIRNIDIIPQGGRGQVKIYEMLTDNTKSLLWETRNRAKEKNWKYVWTKENRILARKGEGSRILWIMNKASVNQMN